MTIVSPGVAISPVGAAGGGTVTLMGRESVCVRVPLLAVMVATCPEASGAESGADRVSVAVLVPPAVRACVTGVIVPLTPLGSPVIVSVKLLA